MCQAKVHDHINNYKCLRVDYVIYEVDIQYKSGHMKGKLVKRVKRLCLKHAYLHRKKLRVIKQKGHTVTIKETII